jgi:hypothetical protein
MDLVMTDTYWRTINFYNDVDDPSALTTLLSLDLDPTIPTLLTGDFNLHSRSWSPPDWAHSHVADRVEEWLATQTFVLLSAPGVPTEVRTVVAIVRLTSFGTTWLPKLRRPSKGAR